MNRHHAVLAAIQEVDDESEREPGEEAPPVRGRQREHQHQAGEDAHHRNERNPGAAERSLNVRLFYPQNNY